MRLQRPLFNTWGLIQYKDTSYKYRNPTAWGDKTILRLSYLYNRNSYTVVIWHICIESRTSTFMWQYNTASKSTKGWPKVQRCDQGFEHKASCACSLLHRLKRGGRVGKDELYGLHLQLDISQIANALGSTSTRYRSDTKVSDRYLIDVDLRVLLSGEY